ncbi:hypothetical protein [Clostridium sp. JS66]|uniref:hypothetical protein n=1 Tax=Clostridium sp. JS66 TaxID=3064705 RepID=UPI00298D9936|nr:hypothetical protein [Clostridium sp. JS66]WPC42370.1 hypothetical protein Q6H37_02590 [Clostridium sp. JS66]
MTYVNEKVGRILINYVLMKKSLPPIIFFESDMQKHCSALSYFNETEDISKMVDFFEEEVYKTWIRNHCLRLKNLKDFLSE